MSGVKRKKKNVIHPKQCDFPAGKRPPRLRPEKNVGREASGNGYRIASPWQMIGEGAGMAWNITY